MRIGITFSKDIRCWYTNWRGEVTARHIRPMRIYFGSTDWHPEEQWLMEAMDLDKQQVRVFAMRDMRCPVEEE